MPSGTTGLTGPRGPQGVTGSAWSRSPFAAFDQKPIVLAVLEAIGVRPGDRLLVRRGGRTVPLACTVLDESAAADVIDE